MIIFSKIRLIVELNSTLFDMIAGCRKRSLSKIRSFPIFAWPVASSRFSMIASRMLLNFGKLNVTRSRCWTTGVQPHGAWLSCRRDWAVRRYAYVGCQRKRSNSLWSPSQSARIMTSWSLCELEKRCPDLAQCSQHQAHCVHLLEWTYFFSFHSGVMLFYWIFSWLAKCQLFLERSIIRTHEISA